MEMGGGVWWRMEVGTGGEEKRGKGEKNGWWRRKEGEGRKEWKGVGIIRFNGRRCERQPLVYSIAVVQNAGQ